MSAPTTKPPSRRKRLPPAARVRSRAEFDAVFAGGQRTASPLLALHWLRDQAPARLGLAVSRKVDARAVGRNRIKRQVRACFRQWRAQLAPGAYVVVARAAAATASNAEVRAALASVLTRAGALPSSDAAGTMAARSPPQPPSASRETPSQAT